MEEVGAGNSTTLLYLAGLLRPREGSISLGIWGVPLVGGALEGWLLIHFAADRMRERGLEFALAEAR